MISNRALTEFRSLWQRLDPVNDPADTQDRLLELVPAIVNRWGEVAASVSADWYSDARPGRSPVLAESLADEFVSKRVRFGAQRLWSGEPDRTFAFTRGLIDEYVLNAGRHTIADAAERDGFGWSRVLGGPNEGPFCLGLAGPAGPESRIFRPHCSCVVVPG